jgi:hypothetical protein
MSVETGVQIVASISFSAVAYGDIENAMREGNKELAKQLAFEIIIDRLNCGYTADIKVDAVEVNFVDT